jgi:hypothetical protein
MFYMLEMWLITAVSQSVSSTKIDPLPALPVVPTVDLLCNLLAVYKQER